MCLVLLTGYTEEGEQQPSYTPVETDYQRYSQIGSECRVHNINGRAMSLDSPVRMSSPKIVRIDKRCEIANSLPYRWGLTNKRQEVSRSDKKRQEVSRSVKNMFLLIMSNIYY